MEHKLRMYICILKSIKSEGAGEMVQQLGEPITLAENLGSIPIWQLTSIC